MSNLKCTSPPPSACLGIERRGGGVRNIWKVPDPEVYLVILVKYAMISPDRMEKTPRTVNF